MQYESLSLKSSSAWMTATTKSATTSRRRRSSHLYSAWTIAANEGGGGSDDEEEGDEEETTPDPYQQFAQSEFGWKDDDDETVSSSALMLGQSKMDWGGALGLLRKRVEDIESGKSQDPSNALFRLMTAKTPNEVISKFVSTADPQVVSAMSTAVTSLLGGLSNPVMGFDTIVKTTGDKLGNLCIQLQMTGYMFRNAEYVVALKKLMDLSGGATLKDYKDAFEKLDTDGSGYIESDEVQELLDQVYGAGKTPAFEVSTFIEFFDRNQDGKISWSEFELGLGNAMANAASTVGRITKSPAKLVPSKEEDEDDDFLMDMEPEVYGEIEIELEDGKVIKVEAQEYIENLKQEAKALQDALAREQGLSPPEDEEGVPGMLATDKGQEEDDEYGGIVGYIASRQGDLKGLTAGIQPEIVETMKRLVDYVLETGEGRDPKAARDESIRQEDMQLELPGAALQQLALWQLVLGYRLREAEAKGEYRKLLE